MSPRMAVFILITTKYLSLSESVHLRRMSDDSAIFRVYDEMQCEDTETVAYQFLRSSSPPSNLLDAQTYCGKQGLTLCGLETLEKVFDAPARYWKTELGCIDYGDDSLRGALVADDCQDYDVDWCYKDKIVYVPPFYYDPSYMHCCGSEMASCGKLTTAKPILKEIYNLWCKDTEKYVYKFMVGNHIPRNLEETKIQCESDGMKLCSLDDLVAVFQTSARKWVTDWAYINSDNDEMWDAHIENLPCFVDEEDCYKFLIDFSDDPSGDLNKFHCCGDEVQTCGSLHDGVPTDDAVSTSPAPDGASTTREATIDLTVEGGMTPAFSDYAELWCEDTNTPLYKFVESAPPPGNVPTARQYCKALDMYLCTLDDLITVLESPGRQWYTKWGFVDQGNDDPRDAKLIEDCGRYEDDECWKNKVPNTGDVSDDLKRLHCCSSGLNLCAKTTSPLPRPSRDVNALWCKETRSPVYKLIDAHQYPRRYQDVDRHCVANGMTLCTLDDLITVFDAIYDSPPRMWENEWGHVGGFSDEKMGARIGPFPCGSSDDDDCYMKKIEIVDDFPRSDDMHCCSRNLQWCPTLVGELVTPTEASGKGEVIVVIDVPLDQAPEIFK